VRTLDWCQNHGGSFYGFGIACDPNPCVAHGACCVAGEGCQVRSLDDCLASSGEFLGPGITCQNNPCRPGWGACCYEDDTCGILRQGDCESAGGTFMGEDENCYPNPCIPSGADDTSTGWLPGTKLLGARPNPFQGTTDILFRLGSETKVAVSIYDAGGRLVRTLVSQTMAPGEHRVTWDGDVGGGGRAGAGVYLCGFRAGEVKQSLKIFCYR
jgi:hypothetical protein